jgi:hypothetical protein
MDQSAEAPRANDEPQADVPASAPPAAEGAPEANDAAAPTISKRQLKRMAKVERCVCAERACAAAAARRRQWQQSRCHLMQLRQRTERAHLWLSCRTAGTDTAAVLSVRTMSCSPVVLTKWHTTHACCGAQA